MNEICILIRYTHGESHANILSLARPGGDATPLMFFYDSVKTAARRFGIAYGQPFYACPEIFGPVDLSSAHQVTKRSTMPGPNFNYFYEPVPPTGSDQLLPHFQDVLSSTSRTTCRSFLY